MTTRIPSVAQATSIGALLLGGTLALATTTLPPVQHSGAIEYLSGGVGIEQATAMSNASPHWPLTLEFVIKAPKRDEFVAGVDVTVRDTQGRAALKTTADGPFLLARLTPGRYAVEATLDGKTLHEKVDVKADHPAKAVFVWPAGTDHRRS